MTPDRLPWLRFFPQDFLGDGKVQMMNATERGVYISLLCYEWSEGAVPDDPRRLARICGTDPETMEDAWPQVRPCFEEREDGMLVQSRLEEEREKALSRHRDAREAARSRWGDGDAEEDADASASGMRSHSEGNAGAMRSHSEGNAGGNANQNQNQKQQQQQKGRDVGSGRNATAHADASDDLSPAVEKVWAHYVSRYAERYSPERADRLKLTAAGRDGKIRGRLREGYEPDDLCRAIDGCFGDDWHRERDKHDLSYILRNQEKVEGFISRADRNGGPPEDGDENDAVARYRRTQETLAAYDGDDGE